MPDTALKCPECDIEADGKGQAFTPLSLGRHRFQQHQVRSEKPSSRKRRGSSSGGAPKDRAPRAPAPARQPSLKKELTSTFKVIGTVVSVGDPYCGAILMQRSAPFVDALATLAQSDPRVGKWLRSLGKAGPYGALFIAAAEIGIPIAAHHNLVPRELAVLSGAPVPPVREPRPAPEPIVAPDVDDELDRIDDVIAGGNGQQPARLADVPEGDPIASP